MKKQLVIAVCGAFALTISAFHSSLAVTPATTTFTSAQVAAGSKVYAANCSKCHGANLQGVSAPALTGSGSGIAGDTIAEAYTFISTQMPAGNPGSLTSAQYSAVVAYILSRNGHQPGATTLTPSAAKLSHVKI